MTARTKPTKVCACCGESKPRDEFYYHAKTADRLRPDCAECFDSMGLLTESERQYVRQLDEHRRAEIARINEQFGEDALAVKFCVHPHVVRMALRRA